MFWFTIAIMLAGGVLGAAGVIIAKKPNAKELIDKLVPYQGYVGGLLCAWGVWWTISAVLNMRLLKFAPIFWILWLVCGLVSAGLGFLLGYGLIVKYVLSKNPTAAAKGEQVQKKLVAFQVPLGFASIALAVFFLVYRFIGRVG